MKIVFLENVKLSPVQKSELSKFSSVEFYKSSTPAECKDRVKDADVVVVDWIEPNEFLEDMKRGSLLSLMSTGFAWVDTKKAKNLGVTVTNIPGYATEAVSEFLIGSLIMLIRKINIAKEQLKNRNWSKEGLEGTELKGKTLGIIGLGKIGSRVASICQVFGMRILTYNRSPLNQKNIKDVKLDELLEQSDVICVTCSVNETSKDLLNKTRLNLLKKDAVVLASTWDIIDIDALTKKMLKNEIAGVAIDVAYEGKRPILPKGLLKLNNAILTPHIAYNTSESEKRRIEVCLDNIRAFVKGKPKNIVS